MHRLNSNMTAISYNTAGRLMQHGQQLPQVTAAACETEGASTPCLRPALPLEEA
jgi:hypothetical protein